MSRSETISSVYAYACVFSTNIELGERFCGYTPAQRKSCGSGRANFLLMMDQKALNGK